MKEVKFDTNLVTNEKELLLLFST